MIRTKFSIILSLLLIAIGLSSCNQSDNLSSIFLKNGKKMTHIAYHHKGKPTPTNPELTTEELREQSSESNYILTLDGTETDDKIENGNFSFKLIDTTVYGSWFVDGKTRKFSMATKGQYQLSSRERNDRIAKKVFESINKTYKYTGDNKTLLLHFEDQFDSRKPFMMFKVANKE